MSSEKNNIEETHYLMLLQDILDNGEDRKDRTGVGTKALFGKQLKFSLRDNKLPLLTTKKMFTRGAVEELLFFLRGDTDTKKLEEKGVNIWKGNTSREFLDKRGLYHLEEGNMGKGYGFQWRNFGGTDIGNGTDQVVNVLHSLKHDPYGRRHIISAWNPHQEQDMALPPCHHNIQFYVNNKKELSCMWLQRSVDSGIGLPVNIVSYALLTHIFAKALNYTTGDLIFNGGDCHIYNNNIDQVKLQLTRNPYPFPTLTINKEISNIYDIENLSFKDFEIHNYQHHPKIKVVMAI